MLVFIDESGDPGFMLEKGSSSLFVIGMVIFDSIEAARKCQERIDELAEELRHKPEFKFNNCSNDVRDGFFRDVSRFDFVFRAMIVDKTIIHSEHLRARTERFYNYFIQLLIKHHRGSLKNAIVIIDGSGSRQFRRNLNAYLRKQIPLGTISKIRMKDSKGDRLLQLADMCTGAIYRSWRKDAKQDSRWRDILAPRIKDEWPFK